LIVNLSELFPAATAPPWLTGFQNTLIGRRLLPFHGHLRATSGHTAKVAHIACYKVFINIKAGLPAVFPVV